MIFTKRFRYRFGDIDDAGIAYYPTLFHYFHCCFEDWWSDALGVAYPEVLHDEKFGLPAVHVDGDFYSPIRYGDEPDIHLGVLRMSRSSVEFGFWMTREGDPRPLCRARVVTVAIDMGSLQKQPLPERWRQEFEKFKITADEFPSAT